MSKIKMIPMRDNKYISPKLLDRWIAFASQEPALAYIADPKQYLFTHCIDPRNYCIRKGLINQWEEFKGNYHE